ncbi:MAG: CFI-box-CTERM domain-containing protein, partial [Gammaproteobacteria bacterium]
PTTLGRAFVEWYYRTSPPYAAVIAEHPHLRQAVRLTLWPLVYSAKGLLWVSGMPYG